MRLVTLVMPPGVGMRSKRWVMPSVELINAEYYGQAILMLNGHKSH